MAHPVTLIAVLAIAAVLGVAGPFGTDDRLALLQRLVYWLAIVALTYGIGSICDALVTWRMARLRFWLNVTITALVTGICANLVVIGVNLITFGWLPGTAELPTFLATTFGIAAIVTTALALVKQQAPEATASPPPAPPRILQRMPVDKRGALVALCVEDHYVRIQTVKGEALVLLRLSDAMNEVGDTPGARVHRSHWAAFDQVRSARRAGDRAILTMSNGAEIPVSRANIAAIREAGLLP